MIISDSAIELANKKINDLTDSEITNIIQKFDIESFMIYSSIDRVNLKKFLNENYVYVLPVLKYLLNSSTIKVNFFCKNCNRNTEHLYNMNDGKLKCLICGNEDEYKI